MNTTNNSYNRSEKQKRKYRKVLQYTNIVDCLQGTLRVDDIETQVEFSLFIF
jgi:hypothetical protein